MDRHGVDEMLRQDGIEWDGLVASLDSHAGQPLHGDGSAWVSRDDYTHLARWMDHSLLNITRRLEGLPAEDLSAVIDEVNARWQAEDSHLSLEEARGWAFEAFDRRAATIRAIPTDRWDPELEEIARADGAEHFAAHRAYIASHE